MAQRSSVARAVLVFALSGLLVLVLVGIAGAIVVRRLADREATAEAENLAIVTARGVVQPRLTGGLVKGDVDSLILIDNIVSGAVLREPIRSVRIWTPHGKIVYADVPELIGTNQPLSQGATRAIASGEPITELGGSGVPGPSDPGDLTTVWVPVQTPTGGQLLYEATISLDQVRTSGTELWGTFLPVLAIALVAFALLLIPFAWRFARQVRDYQKDRERLLQRAIEASDLERRRISGDLHDGLIQEMAGLSMTLAATADTLAKRNPEAAALLRDASAKTREGMRSLRSAVMGIYPPSVQRAGLVAALSDLIAPLQASGTEVALSVEGTDRIRSETQSILFRCSQEALRNIGSHARASSVSVAVSRERGKMVLRIEDDGVGFSETRRIEAGSGGHMGLRLIDDLVREAGGTFTVTSEEGSGTQVRVEVPT